MASPSASGAETAAASRQVVACGSYDIVIGLSLLGSSWLASDIAQRMSQTSTFVILTDTNVRPLYGDQLQAQLQRAVGSHKRVLVHAMPAGEASKCRAMKAAIEDDVLFHHRCHRDTCVIALGGGVVGDLSGFIAASYMRGIDFIQVPTSLLACVDSSIGGKTGIDVEAYGKNLLGAFHMPNRVYIDLELLRTLPAREWVNGMAEVIKAGAIFDAELFDLLEASADQVLAFSDMALIQRIVAMAVQVKAHVVTQDTKERGIRAILNFGHSIGHGIEALVQPEYLHGECVSIGMIKEAEIARGMGICSSATVGRLRRCLSAYGLPVRVPAHVETESVLVKMEVDKKNSQGVKKIVLLERIGSVLANPYARAVEDEQIALVLEKQVQMVPGKAAKGSIRVPGSKSISNRVLLMAALGEGSCRIRGLLHSDDTQVMMNALLKLGARFTWEENGAVVVVEGTAGAFQVVADGEEIYLSNAGTAARFLTSTLTLVKAGNANGDGKLIVTGNDRMKERPIGPLVDALRSNGCQIEYMEQENCPPLAVQYTGLRGGSMQLAGKVSSQYVSSVLISAPYAAEPLLLELAEEQPTSLPYILMTTRLMQQFGIAVETLAPNKYRVPCGVYKNPATFSVEVDASSATYPLALAAITSGDVTVEDLGNTSLQGDAAFHTLLKSMGCTTIQDGSTTRVQGPPSGQPLNAVEIDMETMTDAFMTAVALAAVAKGTTKITGIANQRVKECNRIEVMVTELRKLGIECGELEDGIWITGTAGETSHLKRASITCHNDHRIAMSFAVLGAKVKDVIITDKECTDKTYPEFWDHVQMHLGLQVAPVLQSHADAIGQDGLVPALFVIGMRGAGKSSLSKATAKALGMNLLDTDEELEREFGESISSFVARHNGQWDAFRLRQKELLLRLLSNPPEKTIVSCGGGVVETPEIVSALANYPYVVHVYRAIEDVCAYLDKEVQQSHRPSLGEAHMDVWKRRQPLYKRASSFEFRVLAGDYTYERINRDFVRLVSTILPNMATSFDYRQLCHDDTFFLSLTYPDISDASAIMSEITTGVDAVELRVDLLEHSMDEEYVANQVTTLRQMTTLPIIFTVRSKHQGGAFPDDQEAKMFALLRLGVRLGCEFVDMECGKWSRELRSDLMARRHRTAIIASYHAVQDRLPEVALRGIFADCYHHGNVQIVKVVTKAFEFQDTQSLVSIADEFRNAWKEAAIPVIALCTTDTGKLSRVLNRVLTPVTHPSLPAAAAPGQLSVKQIMTLRKELGLLSERHFHLFGSPIQLSPSPAMHNAAFQVHGLPFIYSLCETDSIDDVVNCMNCSAFGGASVTIPHKVEIMRFLDHLSPAARAIGAVNTVTCRNSAQQQRVLYGDNTDWLGILRPIKKRLGVRQPSSLVALVIGAGGTSLAAAFAMRQLGIQELFIFNRTWAKAHSVAQQFDATALKALEQASLPHVDIVVSTVPASAEFQLPEYLVGSHVIVLDAAYQPPVTPLLAQLAQAKAQCIQGYEMLYEQAYEQYQRWHKATQVWRIDEDVMQAACLTRIPPSERLN